MHSSHLLIGKAGGATVQETIAAGSPMIINQVVPGQEEGNARLIVETGCGVVATSPEAVAAEVSVHLPTTRQLWREWFANIRQLGRPECLTRYRALHSFALKISFPQGQCLFHPEVRGQNNRSASAPIASEPFVLSIPSARAGFSVAICTA